MKLLHLGDLHLGKSLYDFDLKDDQEYILNQVLDIIHNESIDVLLIAGDVYDRAVPSEAATNLLDDFLNKLAKTNAKTFIISGNHDSDDRLNYGSKLFQANNIYICAKYDGHLYRQTIEDEYGEVDVYLLPYVKHSQVRHFFPEESIETYEDAVKTVLQHAEIDETRRRIIVAHQFVTGGGSDPVLGGSEASFVQNVGTIEKISSSCFDGFDYVALGHIHSPQRVGRDEVRYSGSPLKYSLSEINNKKSVPVVTLGKKNEVSVHLVPLEPMRDLRHIKGKMAALLDKGNIVDKDDFIYVTLTDEEKIDDAIGIFRQEYPNTVKLDYDNSYTKELEKMDLIEITANQTFPELINSFFEWAYGREMNKEEMDVMKQVAGEAGVWNEAD